MKMSQIAVSGLATTAVLVAGLVSAAPAVSAAPPPAELRTVADWQLNELASEPVVNEPPRVMIDSSGNGLDGQIGAEVVTGVVPDGASGDGATGYRFARLRPNTPPTHPEHNVLVPHDGRLNPEDNSYTVEIRYRTTNSFGNLIQKGQAGAQGGYWKIQLPKGEPSCLFRGATGITNAVRARGTPINDGLWHTVMCRRTTDAVELFVDGAFIGRNRGLTGAIANTEPLSLGGKYFCDQVKITCDYFGGDVDWVRITAG